GGQERRAIARGMSFPHGRRHADRLVEREVPEVGIGGDADAVHPDVVPTGIDSIPEGRLAAVDRDPAISDEVFAGASRSEPRSGQRALEALLRHERAATPAPLRARRGAVRAAEATRASPIQGAPGTPASSRTAPGGA